MPGRDGLLKTWFPETWG